MESRSGKPQFASTHWSQVQAAGRDSSPQAREALSQLCETYWYPLYVFVRQRGHSSHDARDLVQSFIARLIERNDFQTADPSRGRFRTFLLASLSNFLANQYDMETAKKRGGGATHLTFDWAGAESRYNIEPTHDQTPEKDFDRNWALTVLSQVLEKLCAEYEQAGNQQQFELLSPFLTGDAQVSAKTYPEISETSGMSVSAIKTAVHRMRKRYRDLLRQQVSETIQAPNDTDEEIRELLSALRG